MADGSSGVMRYVITWVRLWFGAHLLYSGFRFYVSGTVPTPHPVAGPFIASLNATGIYPLIKNLEIVTGAMIFFNLMVPLALVVEFPISVVIFILNFFIVATERQLVSGPLELIVNSLLLVFYARYYLPLVTPVAPPRPLWTAIPSDVRAPQEQSR